MRRKVLVVDDSMLLHKMYGMALEAYPGREVKALFASDGAEGLARLHEHPDIALVFLDVNMPTMSGLEFLRRVRTTPTFDDVRVVLQSTEDSDDDVTLGLETGADAYLRKPFGHADLFALLDRLLA